MNWKALYVYSNTSKPNALCILEHCIGCKQLTLDVVELKITTILVTIVEETVVMGA